MATGFSRDSSWNLSQATRKQFLRPHRPLYRAVLDDIVQKIALLEAHGTCHIYDYVTLLP
jgi:hypothetical protein